MFVMKPENGHRRFTSYWERAPSRPLSIGLSLLSLGYRSLYLTREALFASGVLRTQSLPVPVIGVGNLTVGGTGKTPAVELVARTLQDLGRKPAIVSRGYGRTSRGIVVASDGVRLLATPEEAGDEPYLLARRLPNLPIVVGRHRYRAGKLCVDRFRPDALVLDDSFQHRTLKKDLEILLINGQSPWGNGHLFPRGPLREPFSSVKRASMLVITRPPRDGALRSLVAEIRLYHPDVLILTADYEASRPVRADGSAEGYDGRPLLAFCGIADPESFRRSLAESGVKLLDVVHFPDHHWYGEDELSDLGEAARERGAAGLVTTEKDQMRIARFGRGPLPLFILPVRLRLLTDEKLWRDRLATLASHMKHEVA